MRKTLSELKEERKNLFKERARLGREIRRVNSSIKVLEKQHKLYNEMRKSDDEQANGLDTPSTNRTRKKGSKPTTVCCHNFNFYYHV